jgi:hypothetical protein
VVEADAYLRGYAVGKSVYWRFCESTVPPFAWSEFVQRDWRRQLSVRGHVCRHRFGMDGLVAGFTSR